MRWSKNAINNMTEREKEIMRKSQQMGFLQRKEKEEMLKRIQKINNSSLKGEISRIFDKQLQNIILDKFGIKLLMHSSGRIIEIFLRFLWEKNRTDTSKLIETTLANISYLYRKDEVSEETLRAYITTGSLLVPGMRIIKVGHQQYVYISLSGSEKGKSNFSYASVYLFGKRAHYLLKEFIKFKEEKVTSPPAEIYTLVMKENKVCGSDTLGMVPRINDSNYMLSDYIKKYLRNYLNRSLKLSKDLFTKFKITRPLGIIIYGKPGTGKTTMIYYISNILDCQIVRMKLSDMRGSVEQLKRIYSVKSPTIAVYEDIDVYIKNRDDCVDDKERDNFSTLLEVLDGSFKIPNLVNIATTNHIDKIDPAITRSGRFDISIELEGLTVEMAKKLCKRFEVDDKEILAGKEYPINPAQLEAEIINKLKTFEEE